MEFLFWITLLLYKLINKNGHTYCLFPERFFVFKCIIFQTMILRFFNDFKNTWYKLYNSFLYQTTNYSLTQAWMRNKILCQCFFIEICVVRVIRMHGYLKLRLCYWSTRIKVLLTKNIFIFTSYSDIFM